jgi:hypothetical protein
MSAAHPAPLQKGYAAGPGDRRLRASVLFAVAAQSLFLVFLTVFLFNHANPKCDGMEMVASGAAFMLIFMPFSLPAFILAKEGRHLVGRRPSRWSCHVCLFRLLVRDSC